MGTETELYLKIRSLKVKMIETSNEMGMNHPLTVETSQQLDRLIIDYMKLSQESNYLKQSTDAFHTWSITDRY